MRHFLFALFLTFFSLPAFALSSDWAKDDAVAVRLISGNDGVGTAATVPLGLEITLQNGWHTYWRSPGEAGLPPQLDWTRSQSDDGNVQDATLLYPAPRRYTAYGLETVGYRDHVIFPIDVVLRSPGHPLNADVAIDLLVCSSVCVPKHFDLKLNVPTGDANPGAESDALKQARATLPVDPDSAGLLLQSIHNDGHKVGFDITSRDNLTAPDIFVEDDQNIGFGAPVVAMDPQNHRATLTVQPVDTLPQGVTLAGMKITATIIDGDRATEIKTVISPVAAAMPAVALPQASLAVALIFALLGGFILNLMPCVLPVLSLKIISVASHGGGSTGRVRKSFVMTALGILFSFLVLAGVIVTLKNMGMAFGWGVQFQQPVFLMFLIVLLTFFAANLWDLFDIPLPRFLADASDRLYHPKLAGDFVTGAFATLLATPCSAPFLGTAVGFALASGTPEIMGVFAALGLGMALPYLLIALFPRIATLLPKPGAWMIKLRHILGYALAATAVWLIWVLSAQITVDKAILFGLFMAAIVILLALKKYGWRKKLIRLGIVEFCIAALIIGIAGSMAPKPPAETDKKWISYNQNALDADIAEGKTVFLDVTADWCLTCKANMRFTLSNPDIMQRLFHTDIIAMQGDWTNPDPAITDLLHRYGRYGIPFNIVYGPNAPQGILLPELLTNKDVINALDKAMPIQEDAQP